MAKSDKRTFEHGDGRFWEVWIDGKTVYTRFGKLGATGQTKLKELATPAAAKAELDKQIADKVKQGFGEGAVPAAPAGGDPRNPELERAILANPYDADAYLVYADWLQDQGDPRGELIALQAHAKAKPAKALLAKHAAYFLGSLEADQQCRDGYHWEKTVPKEAFTWQFGFIHGARLSHDNNSDEEWKGEMSEVLERLLAHPSGRFLAELTLMYNGDPTSDGNLQSILDVLAKRPRPTLRKLRIGDNVDQISWYEVGSVAKIWKALPNLATFDIEAGSFTLGTIDAPALRVAKFKTGGLGKASAKSIAKIAAPKLEHLEVYFGDDNYGGDATVKDIAPLLARGDLPALRYLGLENARFADDLCELLPGAKLLGQLTVLDLSKGILTDAGAQVLADHAKAFAHLDVLDLSDNYLTDAGIRLVKKLAKKVITDDQKEDEDDDPAYRYVSVAE